MSNPKTKCIDGSEHERNEFGFPIQIGADSIKQFFNCDKCGRVWFVANQNSVKAATKAEKFTKVAHAK